MPLSVAPLSMPAKSNSASRRPIDKGQAFGTAGQSEILSGRFYGELDPKDPRNAIVTDLQLAPQCLRNRGVLGDFRNL
jgi:hypothetical protein